MSEPIDESTRVGICKLVDGELSQIDRASLLRKLECSKDGWRVLALAFVENQVFQEASCQFFERPESVVVPSGKEESKKVQSTSWSYRSIWVIAGLIFGFLVGAVMFNPSTERPVVPEQLAGVRPDVAPQKQRIENQSTLPAELSLSEALSRSSVPIPIEFRREMRSAGYLVNEEHREAKVSLPSGKKVSVPVRNVEVRFLGTSAYQ